MEKFVRCCDDNTSSLEFLWNSSVACGKWRGGSIDMLTERAYDVLALYLSGPLFLAPLEKFCK